MNSFNLFKKQESKESVSNSALETRVCDFSITNLQLGILVTGHSIIVTKGIFFTRKNTIDCRHNRFQKKPLPRVACFTACL